MDYMPDSPMLGESWCPTCAPERDPSVEILDTRYCDAHLPPRSGAEDGKVIAGQEYLSGAGDIDPATNRAFGDLFRRG